MLPLAVGGWAATSFRGRSGTDSAALHLTPLLLLLPLPLLWLLPLLSLLPLEPLERATSACPACRSEGVAGGVSGREGGWAPLLLDVDWPVPCPSAPCSWPPVVKVEVAVTALLAALLAAVAAVLGVPPPVAARFLRRECDRAGVPNVTTVTCCGWGCGWAADVDKDKAVCEPRLCRSHDVCAVWVVLRLLIVSYVGRYGRLPVGAVAAVGAAPAVT